MLGLMMVILSRMIATIPEKEKNKAEEQGVKCLDAVLYLDSKSSLSYEQRACRKTDLNSFDRKAFESCRFISFVCHVVASLTHAVSCSG